MMNEKYYNNMKVKCDFRSPISILELRNTRVSVGWFIYFTKKVISARS